MSKLTDILRKVITRETHKGTAGRVLIQTEAAIQRYIEEQIIQADEDLNAPLDRAVDGNPESDTTPDRYIVRRAVRNVYRAEQRARLRGDSA